MMPPRHRKWPWILLGALVVAAIAAGSYFGGWQRIWPPQQSVQSSASPSPSVATDSIKTALDLTYIVNGVINVKPAVFSTNTPTEWRAQGPDANSCSEDPGYANLYVCAKYSFADAVGSPKSLNGESNSIIIYDLTNWLTSSTVSAAESVVPYFADLQKAADKQAAWNELRGLTASSKFSRASINGDKIINPFLTNAAFVGPSVPQYVESTDGSLKGYAFMSSLCQNECYQPRAFVVLGGEVSGIPVLVTGSFVLHDQKRAAFDKLAPSDPQRTTITDVYSNDSFVYPSDTKALFNDVLNVMMTASLKAK
jgi:hypothetical protein